LNKDAEFIDIPHHCILNVLSLFLLHKYKICNKKIKMVLTGIYVLGFYYLLQRWLQFYDPINIVGVPCSIFLFIFTSQFNCTIVYCWQYNRMITNKVLCIFLVLSSVFALGDAGEDKYLLILEYLMYCTISYRYL
ncbi:Hypothetical protein ORPV_149, partial [Orpheovirus IHUMI-LCC2]